MASCQSDYGNACNALKGMLKSTTRLQNFNERNKNATRNN